MQKSIFNQSLTPSDVVYTPRVVSKYIIDYLQPSGTILDPCKGDGSFYDQLPKGSRFCEIEEGKDFFDESQAVDWIIGNPPYSIFESFLAHSFGLAQDVSFLLPINKVFQRQKIMDMINQWGGGEKCACIRFGNLDRISFWFLLCQLPF